MILCISPCHGEGSGFKSHIIRLDYNMKNVFKFKMFWIYDVTISFNDELNLYNTGEVSDSLLESSYAIEPKETENLTADDIKEARVLLRAAGGDAGIIAKIERSEAIHNLDGIIQASDAVMIARGDLGIEVAQEKIPGIQRQP